MRFATVAIFAAALGQATGAVAQIQVVSADQEYELAHPKPVAKAARTDFHSTMDQVFGAGRWRETSGYRTQAQEDALRRSGAGTVAPGHTSLHSVGAPDAPGAYDAVVDHMPLASAAAKLKQSGAGISRVLAEGAHGPQGAHLHVELINNPGRVTTPVADSEGPMGVIATGPVGRPRRVWRPRVIAPNSAAF